MYGSILHCFLLFFIIYIFIRQKAEETSEKKATDTQQQQQKTKKTHKKHCQSGRTSEHLFKELKLFKQFIYVRTKKKHLLTSLK